MLFLVTYIDCLGSRLPFLFHMLVRGYSQPGMHRLIRRSDKNKPKLFITCVQASKTKAQGVRTAIAPTHSPQRRMCHYGQDAKLLSPGNAIWWQGTRRRRTTGEQHKTEKRASRTVGKLIRASSNTRSHIDRRVISDPTGPGREKPVVSVRRDASAVRAAACRKNSEHQRGSGCSIMARS